MELDSLRVWIAKKRSLPVVKSARAGERGMRTAAVSPEKHFLRESLIGAEDANREEQRRSKMCISGESGRTSRSLPNEVS